MKASEIFAAVNLLVEARQPVFVWGAPGVGKSQVMAQVAQARMVTNVVEIVDVLPRLNISGDEELSRMTDTIRHSLLVDTDELRKSEALRTDTAKAATDIMQRMAAYMGLPTESSLPHSFGHGLGPAFGLPSQGEEGRTTYSSRAQAV